MPIYDYVCYDCLEKLGNDDECIFETMHSINATEEELKVATKCPTCGSNNTNITLKNNNQSVFIRGIDWHEYKKKNYSAIKRDMTIHTLQNSDPYADFRPDGDKEQLLDKFNSDKLKKKDTKYFT